MAIKKPTLKPKSINKVKKEKKPANWLLRFTIIILLIPIIVVAYLLLSSMGESTSPVVGSRFKNSLDPSISDTDVTNVKNSLVYAESENVSVNLISATLRITINTKDETTLEQCEAITNDAYNKVNSILPIKKYFTNKSKDKMYDLEISVYNFIAADGQDDSNCAYVVLTKTGASTSPVTDVVSTPKNETVEQTLLNGGAATTTTDNNN